MQWVAGFVSLGKSVFCTVLSVVLYVVFLLLCYHAQGSIAVGLQEQHAG